MSEKKNEQNDDFLDFSTIKEEINDGPSEEEFTRAMDQMSKTDRDILHIRQKLRKKRHACFVVHLRRLLQKHCLWQQVSQQRGEFT